MPKASKKRVKSVKAQDKKRKQRRFSTSATYMPAAIAVLGMVGCALLGAGVFGMWIADPPITWASYLVAAGGFGLGIALWFGQPDEVAVAVGDAGVMVDNGRQATRLNWFEIDVIRQVGAKLLIEGHDRSLRFVIMANRSAASYFLKQAAERVPDVLDVDPGLLRSLPDPKEVRGVLEDVEDDQVAGTRCAASDELIRMEEDARICPTCGQIYDQAHLPKTCVSCETELGSNVLLA